MGPFVHLVRKELLVIRRDWHALLLLFVMPTLFILLMSLALRDRFAGSGGAPISYAIVNADAHVSTDSVLAQLAGNRNFRLVAFASDSAALHAVNRDRVQFVVDVPAGFGESILGQSAKSVTIHSAPGVERTVGELFALAVRSATTRAYLDRTFRELQRQTSGFLNDSVLRETMSMDVGNRLVSMRSTYQEHDNEARPTSVQQNVPAWLVFAMFFIALPLSTTWVHERSQSTFARLRSMGLSPAVLLGAKLVPYLLINLVQVVLMLLVGVYLVPVFGGDALTLGNSFVGLAIMAVSVGFAATSYGSLIANLVTTSEQATILTGASSLLLAALGGVMVPRFVMPLAMQQASYFSPMAWGLEGFLDCFLREGNAVTVLPRAALLLTFGAVSLVLAGLLLGRARSR